MKTYHLLLILFPILFSACKREDNTPACTLEASSDTRFFEFEHTSSGKTFIAWTNETSILESIDAQLALPVNQRAMHINGPIARLPEGCENLNRDWSWYHKPNEWTLTDFSIELCDGDPQYVEENLDEYIRIGGYCPWGSRVLQEISNPF